MSATVLGTPIVVRAPECGTVTALVTTASGSSTGGLGVGTLLLAMVVGVLGFALLLLVIMLSDRRGRQILVAGRAVCRLGLASIRQRRLPDSELRAETRRCLADALQDMRSVLGDEPSARELAEGAAWAENAAREDAHVRERDRQAREQAREKAAARVAATLRRAQEQEADARAARASLSLLEADLAELPAAEADRLVAAVEAATVRLVAAQRAAAAAEERAAVEIAAAEQAAAARVAAEVAAERAEVARAAAERAAAERAAAERAEAERAAAERVVAERAEAERAEAERAAAERAEAERAAAERAEAERSAAERAEAERSAAERAEEQRAGAVRAEAERAEEQRAAAVRAEAERVTFREVAPSAEEAPRLTTAKHRESVRPARLDIDVREPSRRAAAASGRSARTGAVGHAEPRRIATSQVRESGPLVLVPSVDGGPLLRPPVSWQMARGAPLVWSTGDSYRRNQQVARTRRRLIELRQDDERSLRRLGRQTRALRVGLLALVPAVVLWRTLSGTGVVADAVDGGAGVPDAVAFALALAVVGSVLAWRVSPPPLALLKSSSPTDDSHLLRSLFASEQLAVRLAGGARPSDAWRSVAVSNQFPVDSPVPAASLEDAVALAAQSRRTILRRRRELVRRRVTVTALPVLAFLLPAALLLAVL